jgi:hypothetical protein
MVTTHFCEGDCKKTSLFITTTDLEWNRWPIAELSVPFGICCSVAFLASASPDYP